MSTVVTGVGAVSAIGCGEGFFSALASGASGIGEVATFDPGETESVLAAEMPDFAIEAFLSSAKTYLDRCSALALAAGALAILSALAYTGGPYPLGYNGLGDVFVFIFFGVVGVVGTYYLHTRSLDAVALAASVPAGLLIVNILVVNNLRDIETDRAAGKRTLAVRIGARATRRQYAAQLALSYLIVAALLPWRGVPVLLPFALAPAAWKLAHAVMSNEDPPTFNRLLGRTAQFSLQFGLLFALGLLVCRP